MKETIKMRPVLALFIALLISLTCTLNVFAADFGDEKDLGQNEEVTLLFDPKGGVFLDGTTESMEIILIADEYDTVNGYCYYSTITQEDIPELQPRDGCTFEGWYFEGQQLNAGDRIYDALVQFDAKWRGVNPASVDDNVKPFFNNTLPDIRYGGVSGETSGLSVRALSDPKSSDDLTFNADNLGITSYDVNTAVQLDITLDSGTAGTHGVIITMPVPEALAGVEEVVAIHYGATTEAIACEVSGDTLSFTLENFSPVILMKGVVPEYATVYVENVRGGALVVFDASRGQKVLPIGENVTIIKGATLYTYPYPMEDSKGAIQCTRSEARTTAGRLILGSDGAYAGIMQITVTQDTVISATFERVSASGSDSLLVQPERTYFPVEAGNTGTPIDTTLSATQNGNVLSGATFVKSPDQGEAGFGFTVTEAGALTSDSEVALGSYTIYVDVTYEGQAYERIPVTINSGSGLNIELYIAENMRSGDLLNMLATPLVAKVTTLDDLAGMYAIFPIYNYDTFAGVYTADGIKVSEDDDMVPEDKNYYFLRHADANGNLYSLTVRPLSDGSSGGGSSGGSFRTLTTDVGGVTVPYTKSGGSVTLTISNTKLEEIIAKADGEAVFDFQNITGTTSASLPTEALKKFADERLSAIFKLPQGVVNLDEDALASIAEQAAGTNVTISLKEADSSALTEEQREAARDNTVYDISIVSSSKNISTLGDGEITVTLPYTLKNSEDPAGVCVWYLDDKGNLEKIPCTYDERSGTVRFSVDHLSYFAVGYDALSAWTNPFTDVRERDWFYEDVTFAAQNGLFSGTSATAFNPNSGMTRGMLVTVLWRMAGSPETDGTNFRDVQDDQWYAEAVAWGSANGIVSGISDGLFAPDAPITREQMAVLLYNYAKFKGYSITTAGTLSQFVDGGSVSGWASDAIRWAVGTELISGKPGGILDPQGGATRAEVAAVLHKFMK